MVKNTRNCQKQPLANDKINNVPKSKTIAEAIKMNKAITPSQLSKARSGFKKQQWQEIKKKIAKKQSKNKKTPDSEFDIKKEPKSKGLMKLNSKKEPSKKQEKSQIDNDRNKCSDTDPDEAVNKERPDNQSINKKKSVKQQKNTQENENLEPNLKKRKQDIQIEKKAHFGGHEDLSKAPSDTKPEKKEKISVSKSNRKLIKLSEKKVKLNVEVEVEPVEKKKAIDQQANQILENDKLEEVQEVLEVCDLNEDDHSQLPKVQLERIQVKRVTRRVYMKATARIVDVVFCCDTTSSMGFVFKQTKQTVKLIVNNIKEKNRFVDISVRFGFVCYRDHPPQENSYVTKKKDLCTDEKIINFIEKQMAYGGGIEFIFICMNQGDFPEAVLDGLYVAASQITWRDSRKQPSLRYIFHIADAPPHGKEFGHDSQWRDGVPSGITLEKVAQEINIRDIHYRFINLNEKDLVLMSELFRKNFKNFKQTTLANETELNIIVTDMIINELFKDVENQD